MDEATKKKLPALFLLSFSTFVVCVSAAFTQIISLDLMLDLNAFPSTHYTWTFPLFIAGECASMGLCAGVLDRYGRRMPYLVGSILYIVFTIGCALSTNMVVFNVFRFFQGFGAGIIIVTCIAQIFFDVQDKEMRYMANGIMSLGFGGGMLFGIFAGKAAIESIGWETAFMILAVLQAVVTYPAMQVLSNGRRSEMKADIPAAIILTLWAACFVLFLQKMWDGWDISTVEAKMGIAFLVFIGLMFLVAETCNKNSVFHRKVDNGKLVAGSMIFVFILGVIDMAAVGFMVKVAFFTYQMSIPEAAPYFLILVLGAAITAISVSKLIVKTGHLPWLLLSAVLSPIALLSMVLVHKDDPSFVFALHLFLLGLAIGCLVSMLNATIQNRTNEDNNGTVMSFTIMVRTMALWLGYNFYSLIADVYMKEKIAGTVDHWNEIIPVELPSNSSIANLLVTPLGDLIKLIPGLSDEIAEIFAAGVGIGLTYGAIIFVAIAIPTSFILVGRRKTL